MPSKEPMSTREFSLDVAGLAACYDTSAGVGVTGRGDADRGRRLKGIPFWVVYPAGAAVVLACVLWATITGLRFCIECSSIRLW